MLGTILPLLFIVSKEAINFVLNELNTNPQFRIEIQGHCDAKELKVGEGVDEYYQMDRKRVAAVVKYLVDQGIDPTIQSPAGQQLD